jgi:hypothetical protein
MKHLFDHSATLSHAEDILKTYFSRESIEHNNILNVNITEEDCLFLIDKLSLTNPENSQVKHYYNYQLCILTAITYANIYEIEKEEGLTFIESILSKIPQHHTKYFLEVIATSIDDYNIDTFGEDTLSVTGICEIISLQTKLLEKRKVCA